MVIHPEVIVTPDTPTIRFRYPRDKVNLDVELPRILHAQGWGVGTYFNVQFLNHDKTKLLSCARFVVVEESEALQTNDANPYQTMTKTVFTRRADQVDDWWMAQEQTQTNKPEEKTAPPSEAPAAEKPAARRKTA